jgi:nicotinamide-nucleotide amidase
MENLFERGVLPEFERRIGKSSKREERIFHFYGLSESHLEERFEKSGIRSLPSEEVRIAYTASFPIIDVTLSTGTALADRAEEFLLKELGEHLVGKNSETFESRVIAALARRKWTLATAESLTGGAMAARIVDVAGSSEVLDRGVIAYSNRSKIELLGVSKETLDREGAVSEACALEMARGVRRISGSDVGMASTGIAGPSGGSDAKPVGLTFLAWVGPPGEQARKYQFRYDRNRNRMLAVYEGLKGLLSFLEGRNP